MEYQNQQISLAECNNLIVIEVSGKDSERYLNNRLSNNIKLLKPQSDGIFAAALSPQGKTEGFFDVTKIEENSFLLISDAREKEEEIIKALGRFKVRDQVNINTIDAKVYHLFSETTPANVLKENLTSILKEPGTYLKIRNRFGFTGVDLIALKQNEIEGAITSRFKNLKICDDEQQKFLGYKHFLPKFPNEIGVDYLVQESGLENSLSVNKGCYVGQEITQKIASFANTPAKLYGFQIASDIADENVTSDPQSNNKVAKVISKYFHKESNTTYGFVRLNSNFIKNNAVMKAYIAGQEIQLSPVTDYTKELA